MVSEVLWCSTKNMEEISLILDCDVKIDPIKKTWLLRMVKIFGKYWIQPVSEKMK